MRTLNPDSRGTGRRVGRGREGSEPPPRAGTGPLAGEQASGARESQRSGERQGGTQQIDPTSEPIPGQTELPLTYRQVTL